MNSLKWGQTPWDSMTQEELLTTVWKMYSALVSLNSCLRIQQAGTEGSSYWGKSGAGGEALEKARQILEPLHEQYSSEDIYRSFFRYAPDLLFDRSTGYDIGFGWVVCPKCGVMIGAAPDGTNDKLGKVCGEALPKNQECNGVFRELRWEDLRGDTSE